MKSQFVTYEIALKFKELGFDEPCFCYYGNISQALFGLKGDIKFWTNKALDIFHNDKNVVSAAPLWQQAIDWFREKYGIEPLIERCTDIDDKSHIIYEMTLIGDNFDENGGIDGIYESYEEAREAAILKAIELCQK